MSGALEASNCRMRRRQRGDATDRSGRESARDHLDAVGLKALATLDDLDPHPLTGLDNIELAAPQRRDMNKDVLAAVIGRNKAVTLLGSEPLHQSFDRLRRARMPAIKPAVKPAIGPI